MQARDLAWRHVPAFRVGDDPAPTPTVYYLAPHVPTARGGVRVIYRHVDTLNAAGIPAAVVHAQANYRSSWFANTTRVLDAAEVVLSRNDVLVVPECYGPGLHGLPVGPRVVIFNQAAYHTFDLVRLEDSEPGAPYRQAAGLVALLTVSQDNADLLRHVFPDLPVAQCRQVIDTTVFHPGSTPPRRRLAFTTDRRAQERQQLLHILRARGLLSRWELAPIVGRSEEQTAQIMRESAIFLSFSEREGFGLPPAEAMASGAYVVGYAGLAGREYFDPAYCAPVPDGDLLAFARAVEDACAAYDTDPDAFAGHGQLAAKHIGDRYSPDGLRGDLLRFYQPLVDR